MKRWRIAYGTTLAAFIVAGLGNAAAHWSLLVEQVRGLSGELFLYGLLVHLGLIAAFSSIERLAPSAGPRKPLKRCVLNLQVVLLTLIFAPVFSAAIGFCTVLLGNLLGIGLFDLRFSRGKGYGSLVLAFLLSTLIFDLFYYWFHRFGHESPLLWQQHKVHHMDEELCALNRDHPLETLLVSAAVLVPMGILFKLDTLQGTILGYGIQTWVIFIHTNIKLSLGPASALFAGPQLHRIHHSRLPEHFDQNYAAFFPIWDVIFGTYYHPKRDEYPPTGVHDEGEVSSLVAATLVPFRGWRKLVSSWRESRRAAISKAPHKGSNKLNENGTPEKQGPVDIEVQQGKVYLWCSCGKSKKQPFCDGSHAGTSFSPLRYRASETAMKSFCVCKRTNTPPYCDGSHNT